MSTWWLVHSWPTFRYTKLMPTDLLRQRVHRFGWVLATFLQYWRSRPLLSHELLSRIRGRLVSLHLLRHQCAWVLVWRLYLYWPVSSALGWSGLRELLWLGTALLWLLSSGSLWVLLADRKRGRLWSFHHCVSRVEWGPHCCAHAVCGLGAYQCFTAKSEARLIKLLLLLRGDGSAVAVVPWADWVLPRQFVPDTHWLPPDYVRVWSVSCVSSVCSQRLGRYRQITKGRLHAATRL